MTKSFLPTVELPKRSTKKMVSWNEIKPGSIFGFVSNLKAIGLALRGGRVFIDIKASEVPLMTTEDWVEVQEAVRVFLVDNEISS